MHNVSRRDFLGASALAGLTLAGCGGSSDSGSDADASGAGVEGYDPDLVAAAQAEGELVARRVRHFQKDYIQNVSLTG